MDKCIICFGTLAEEPEIHVGMAHLVRCLDCDSLVCIPRPKVDDLTALHTSAEYFDHPYLQLRRADSDAVDARCLQLFTRISTFLDSGSVRGMKMLDIGCDTGNLLASAKRMFGVIPYGVDVSRRAVEIARNAGIEASPTTLESAPDVYSGFPLITAIDVVEHVADPHSLFQSMSARLAPGGIIYLETPNINSAIYLVGKYLYKIQTNNPISMLERLYPPEHVQYFTVDGLKRIAKMHGLDMLLYGTRVLPLSEIAVGLTVSLGLGALQAMDRVTGRKALLWAALRRPA